MLIFNDYLAKLLPDYIIEKDSYKDINQQGFVERYIRMFGLELDEELYNKIEEVELQLDPRTVTVSEFINYYAVMLGDLPRLIQDNYNYTSLLLYTISIYKIKGTIKSYKALLTALGHTTISIVEIENLGIIYDAAPPILYDTPGIIYDDNCKTCSNYRVVVTTSLPLTGTNYFNLETGIKLLEPINAKLISVIWNGDTVTSVYIEVYINVNGDLIYNNEADPGLVLTLVNGDLIISGPNESRYYLDGGDLYYVN